MKKTIVLHITEAFGGGIFVYLSDLAHAMNKEFDITIAYSLRPETPKDIKAYFPQNVKLVYMQHGQRSISPGADIRYFFEIRQLIDKVQPNVIHLHSSKAGFVGRMATLCKKCSVFYSPHNFSFLANGCPEWKKGFYRAAEQLAALGHATTIGVGREEYELACRLSKRAVCIHNGINTDKLDLFPIREPNVQKPILGTLARVGYEKNPMMFNRIAKEFPDLEFRWIGGGELESELSAENIYVSGWMERQAALTELIQLDIFLIPSLSEGLPMALLEAMYLKKICIGAAIPSIANVIEHGKTGFVAGSFKEYIGILTDIRNGKYDIAKITAAARQSVLQKYSTKTMCAAYAKLYRSCIN